MCCNRIFNIWHNFKQHVYVGHKLVICYTVFQEYMYDICIPWCSPSKNPTTYLCVFRSTPWLISSPDTMFNLKVYNGIPMLDIMSPDIVMFQLCHHRETVTYCRRQPSIRETWHTVTSDTVITAYHHSVALHLPSRPLSETRHVSPLQATLY